MRSLDERRHFADHFERVPAFRLCSRNLLEEIVARLTNDRKVRAGTTLTREGEFGREMFVFLSGTAQRTRNGEVVANYGPGDSFGELRPMDAAPSTVTVTTLTDAHVLIIGPRELSWMADIPSFRDALLREMAQRIRWAGEVISSGSAANGDVKTLVMSSSEPS